MAPSLFLELVERHEILYILISLVLINLR